MFRSEQRKPDKLLGAAPDARRRSLLVAGAAACLLPGLARAQSRRSFVDSAGRSVGLPARVERIYAAGPPASILVFAIAPDRLIGWTSAWREAERQFISRKYADLPTLGRLTGRGNTANIEVVLRAKPDLIIDYGTVSPTLASLADRVQSQTGIPYLLLDGDFARMPETILQIGRIAGEEKRGEALGTYAREMVSLVDQRVARIPAGKRPRIHYGRGPQGLNTGLAGSTTTQFIEQLGAVNVAAGLGRGGLVQVSIEQVLAWNPDVIVTIDRNFHAAARTHPQWRGLPAVRAGRLYLAPALPFGWIDFPPSINRLLGLRWLARILYPHVFPQDLRPIVRDFYSRCYHQTPTDAQLDQLLRQPASAA